MLRLCVILRYIADLHAAWIEVKGDLTGASQAI